jgi:sensor histidine kinase YesM
VEVRKPDRAYWLCQAAGWSLYTAYVLLLDAQYERGFRLKSIVSVVAFLLIAGPLVTHRLRAWIVRNGWLDMRAARVLPRAAAAVLLLSATLGTLTAVVNVLVLRNGSWRVWFPRTSAGITSGYAMVFAIWIWIYFSVQDRRRRRALELKALKLEVVAREATLRTLESQLNPHFLFNALNSVRALVTEDPQRAQTMITRLAELLRYTLRSSGEVVALEDEIGAVEDYLAIERVRFEERLSVEIDLEPAARRQRVPRMLVLTLVENAVKHGISRTAEGGIVRIAAAIQNERVQLQVVNTGLLRSSATGGGVGLRNARERLQLIYGDAATLTLESGGSFVVARVSTPLEAAAAPAMEATA